MLSQVFSDAVRFRLLQGCQYVAMGGGAMFGVMYIGALKALAGADDTTYGHWYRNLRGVAGTSAGSIMAFLVASGVRPDSMCALLSATDLSAVGASAATSTVAQMLHRGSVCLDADLNALLQGLVARVLDLGAAEAAALTLADFAARGLPDLCIVVTNATTGAVDFWKASTHPRVPVWLALRASCCVPGLFPAVHWEGVPYIDGGVTCNLPCHLFPPRQTLALFVHMGGPGSAMDDAGGASGGPSGVDLISCTLKRCCRMVQWYMCAAQLGALRCSVDRLARCIPCVSSNSRTSAFSFDAGPAVLEQLLQDGADAVQAVVVRDMVLFTFVLLALASGQAGGSRHSRPEPAWGAARCAARCAAAQPSLRPRPRHTSGCPSLSSGHVGSLLPSPPCTPPEQRAAQPHTQ